MSNKLIVYYSRNAENYVSGKIETLTVGNTETVAKTIQKLTGADIFKIEQKVPYSESYNECIAQAQDDQRKDARPELKAFPKSLEQYDTIYLGYPNYWNTMPMAMFSFLEHFDFSRKTIKPFCTHEGSAMGRSESDIKRLCPNAKVEKGLAIFGSAALRAEEQIKKWL